MKDQDGVSQDSLNNLLFQSPDGRQKHSHLSVNSYEEEVALLDEVSSSGIEVSNVISIIEAKNEWEHSVDSLKKLAIIILDNELNIVRTNKAIELWGWGDVNSVKGKHIADVIDPVISRDSSESFYRTWVNLDGKSTLEWKSEFNTIGKTLRFSFYPSIDMVEYSTKKNNCFYILIIDDISHTINVENKLKDHVSELKLQKAIDDQKLIHINKMLEMNLKYEKKSKQKIKESEQRLKILSEQLVTAQEEERKRVACELHDGIGQILSLIKYQVESAVEDDEDVNNSDSNKKSHLFGDILNNLITALQEVKRVSMNLRPTMLDTKGILHTLSWFLEEFQKVYKCSVRYEINIDESLITEKIKVALFRIVQEAMNNTAKHAEASHITVTLKEVKNSVLLRILDDGIGFDCVDDKINDATGLGLKNIKERAEQTDAKFTLLSEVGKGTIIQVIWKIEEE